MATASLLTSHFGHADAWEKVNGYFAKFAGRPLTVLAVMGTTGLYETTGEWMFKVGLPGKSGVGGGIISVVPGKYAIAVFSPPLDKAGNSVRAQETIQYISDKLDANIYSDK